MCICVCVYVCVIFNKKSVKRKPITHFPPLQEL